MTGVNRYRPAESRFESDWTFEDEHGHVEHASGAHHVHTTGEVVRMLDSRRLPATSTLKGPDGTAPYELGNHRMIAVATA